MFVFILLDYVKDKAKEKVKRVVTNREIELFPFSESQERSLPYVNANGKPAVKVHDILPLLC